MNKILDLIDRVPEELWPEVGKTVQQTVIKTIPKKNKWERQTGCLRRTDLWLRKEEAVLIVTLPVFIDTVPGRTASHPCWTSFLSLAPPPIISVPSRSQSLMVVVCRYVLSDSCDPMDCSPPISFNSISSPFSPQPKGDGDLLHLLISELLLFGILAFPIYL